MKLEAVEHGVNPVERPELTLIFKRLFALPQPEHDIERFQRHAPIFSGRTVHIEQLPVARQAARSDPQHETALGHMIQKSHPVGQLNRMMIRQKMSTGTEFYPLGAQECLGNEQVRSGVGFPGGGKMLAYPCLVKADAIDKFQVLQVPGMTLVQISFRWV